MDSLRPGYTALVVGASGGIGGAIAARLRSDPRCTTTATLDRRTVPAFDLRNEDSVRDACDRLTAGIGDLDLIIIATGILATTEGSPEKSLRQITADEMLDVLAVNAVGPALLIKHLSPLMPRGRKSILAALSARVGSIGDNGLGGWLSYRTSKAALNQVIRTASIELGRTRPEAVCVALHPGTIETGLSARYARGRYTFPADDCAARLLRVLDDIDRDSTGTFLDYSGRAIPW